MKIGNQHLNIISEEKKALKLFFWLFYIFYYSFDLFYYVIFPIYKKSHSLGVPKGGLGYWQYIIIAMLLPFSIPFLKKGKIHIVKYIFFYSYSIIDFFNNILVYVGTNKSFESGNIVEVLFLLFSPIFINKNYFWTVLAGNILKYILIGVILHDSVVLLPITIFIVMGAIVYIILTRFLSYLSALSKVNDALREKEKLVLVGQMAATIGHEIRNPLASLKGFIQFQHEQYPNTNEYYSIMINEVDRINSIVTDLMYLGRPKSMIFEKANIEEIISYTLSIIRQHAEQQGIKIETKTENPLPPIECDTGKLKQVFINLVKNAIESMVEGGKISILLKKLKDDEIYISIEDQGCGIGEEKISQLGNPFYTTKINGTGLGLMVTNQIIKEHKGSISFQSRIGSGTKVEIILPIKNI